MNEHAHWKHVAFLCALIIGIAILFSVETRKPVDTEGITIDTASVLVMGG